MHWQTAERRGVRRSFRRKKRESNALFRLHPCFLLVGVWYCVQGKLFLFLTSCLVAVQHECAHAFAAAKLGYRLNKIVLMPFGAVIDGDLRGLSVKDELYIALCGPLCNLATAAFFAALWWFTPDTYAFTDVACYTSLAVALVNFLPALPLDGGRVLRCLLTRGLMKRYAEADRAERRAEGICKVVSLGFVAVGITLFIVGACMGEPNLSLLPFSLFLFMGAVRRKDDPIRYEKIDFSCRDAIAKGVELRRVAVSVRCPIKDALRYVERGSYLVLEVYDERECKAFELPQNELDEYFRLAPSPYASLGEIRLGMTEKKKGSQKVSKNFLGRGEVATTRAPLRVRKGVETVAYFDEG